MSTIKKPIFEQSFQIMDIIPVVPIFCQGNPIVRAESWKNQEKRKNKKKMKKRIHWLKKKIDIIIEKKKIKILK